MRNVDPKFDVMIHNHGTIFLFDPLSEKGKAWLDENTDPDQRQHWCESLVVEHRFAEGVAKGLADAGLTIGLGLNQDGQSARFPS